MRQSEWIEKVLDIKLTPWQAMLLNSKYGLIDKDVPKIERSKKWESQAKAHCGEKGLTVLGFENGYIWVDDGSSILPVRESVVAREMGEVK